MKKSIFNSLVAISLLFSICNEAVSSDPLKDDLEKLRSKKLDFSAFTQKVKENKISTSLSLESKDLDEAWKVIDISFSLSQNKTLMSLSLDKPNFGSNPESQSCIVTAIRGIFKCNESITAFSLCCNDDFPPQQIGSLITAFTWYNKKQSLVDVTLKHLGITHLQDAPSTFKNLSWGVTKLDLSHNKIDAIGAKNLGEALKENKTITFLNLDYNNIGDEGALALAESLNLNGTLKTLYLDYNGISSKGAGVIASSLRVNKSLTNFAIQGNPLGQKGIKHFCQLFEEKGSSLQTLWFGNVTDPKELKVKPFSLASFLYPDPDSIDDPQNGYINLGNSLKAEPNIAYLGLQGLSLTEAEAQNFKFLLSTNPRITITLTAKDITEEVKKALESMKDKGRIKYI